MLSGAAMNVVQTQRYLKKILERAATVSKEYPVVVSKFIQNAKEIEFDAVAAQGNILIYAISEHIENAGVHSGDATIVFPAQKMYVETMRKILVITRHIAKKLNITGPFNVQFITKRNQVQVIECNLRASRSIPFVSKIMRKNFIDIATQAIMGKNIPVYENNIIEQQHVGVKFPQFSFARIHNADPRTGVEMASTGEVACIGENINEALLKALLAVDFILPKKTIFISIGSLADKIGFVKSAKTLAHMNFKLYTTKGTHELLKKQGVRTSLLYKAQEKREPNVQTYLKQKKIDLVINISPTNNKEKITDGYMLRRTAADYHVPLITNKQLAKQIVEAMSEYKEEELQVKSWDEYTST